MGKAYIILLENIKVKERWRNLGVDYETVLKFT
jgi:hypothetical protein